MRIYSGLRKKHRLPEELFASDGKLSINNFPVLRRLVFMLNSHKKTGETLYPGELRASSLLLEISQHMLGIYANEIKRNVFSEAHQHLVNQMGNKQIFSLAEDITRCFPPAEVFEQSTTAAQYLTRKTNKRPHLHLVIEEALMLHLANENPANGRIKFLFDKTYLDDPKGFDSLIDQLESFLKTLPPFGPERLDISSFLKTPLRISPNNIEGQIDYVLLHWKHLLPESLLLKLIRSKDLMKEDYHMGGHGAGGAPPSVVPGYGKKGQEGQMRLGKSGFDAIQAASEDYDEAEAFTMDTHWMPRVVLIAKNTYVWLDQLSKKYQREIRRLDQIPDEELDRLARCHFTGLWLIGIWERSIASRKIKHLMGNQDAISSAYALYDYEIASDLGGDQAYHNLNERARMRGLRLASDMVPNHTGIYSRWIIEHPGYFIQSSHSPFPGYSFTGENLSDHPHIEIRIEDGYYNKTDAAVVFQRIDKQHNEVRYIYHGNDGTMMPWNDTAQLDMIKAEVREAVMQKIFGVARKFSIIRFDAAMTLAKKHFSRLWYPRPGSGGDIPSRADHAMSKQAFDKLFPVEFWREVVDRINAELPETLLLAEAFWFMEGYFVRTLGMHRVYNSAFMHMLKNEENEKYRDLISNTLEFEPEILKRYVNFMSNPDEETAIQQFGTGDKYFGICVLMNTLPGLPMFAHGQVEGYTEKYGMEYQRAYYHEQPNQHLIERHEREIFPLMGKRYLFSEVKHFNLYDFIDDDGRLNENVFAFSNRHGDEKALILFNNKYEMAGGHIHTSVPRLSTGGGDKKMTTTVLADAIGMQHSGDMYYHAREHISGMDYLFRGEDIHRDGFHWSLRGFEYRVFLSFRELHDPDGSLATLHGRLGGRGTESLEKALTMQKLGDVHAAFEHIFDRESLHAFIENVVRAGKSASRQNSIDLLCSNFQHFAEIVCQKLNITDNSAQLGKAFRQHLEAIPRGMDYLSIPGNWEKPMPSDSSMILPEEMLVLASTSAYRENTMLLLAYYVLKTIQQVDATKEHDPSKPVTNKPGSANQGQNETGPANHDTNGPDPANHGTVRKRPESFEQLLLEYPLENVLKHTGHSAQDIHRDKQLIEILLAFGDQVMATGFDILTEMLDNPKVREYLGTNQYKGTWYYSKEQFGQLIRWLFTTSYFSRFRQKQTTRDKNKLMQSTKRMAAYSRKITALSDQASYELCKLQEKLRNQGD